MRAWVAVGALGAAVIVAACGDGGGFGAEDEDRLLDRCVLAAANPSACPRLVDLLAEYAREHACDFSTVSQAMNAAMASGDSDDIGVLYHECG